MPFSSHASSTPPSTESPFVHIANPYGDRHWPRLGWLAGLSPLPSVRRDYSWFLTNDQKIPGHESHTPAPPPSPLVLQDFGYTLHPYRPHRPLSTRATNS